MSSPRVLLVTVSGPFGAVDVAVRSDLAVAELARLAQEVADAAGPGSPGRRGGAIRVGEEVGRPGGTAALAAGDTAAGSIGDGSIGDGSIQTLAADCTLDDAGVVDGDVLWLLPSP